MEPTRDLAIIGAGAAGLAAAIFAAEAAAPARQRRIVLLDGAATVGAKILVSGGGRCNVTAERIRAEDYNAPQHIVRHVLAAFDERATVQWMRSLGVELKREETGKLFPVSDSARTVLQALLRRVAELGVELLAGHRVSQIVPENASERQTEESFRITYQNGSFRSRRIILATGGKSLPRSGSDGSGWNIARNLGHSVTDTFPALVPLVLDGGMFHAELSGLSHDAELTTLVDNKPVDRRRGSLLWTHFGISGPVVMDASRFWIMNRAASRAVELRCGFLPGQDFQQVEQWLLAATSAQPRSVLRKILAERVPERLAGALLKKAATDPSLPIGQLSREARRVLVHALTAFPLPVLRERGWNYAEVTAGGVPLAEIDFRTMESRKMPGLYLAGEVLDCDGRIGGFNFQWAWATGHIAGRAAARGIAASSPSVAD